MFCPAASVTLGAVAQVKITGTLQGAVFPPGPGPPSEAGFEDLSLIGVAGHSSPPDNQAADVTSAA